MHNISLAQKPPVKPKNVKPAPRVVPKAATRENKIHARSLTKDGVVYLRWVPGSPDMMKQGVKYGYKIERFSSEAEMQSGGGVVLSNQPFIPLAQNDSLWLKRTKENRNAAFVQTCLFDPGSAIKKNDGAAAGKKDMLFGFALKACEFDFVLSEMAALGLKDKDARGKVAYKISLWSTDPGFKYVPAIISCDQSAETPLPAPAEFSVKGEAKTIRVSWNAIDNSIVYGGYDVMRADDEGQQFKKVNTAPVVFVRTQWEKEKKGIAYIDSLVKPGKTYQYKVVGRTFFEFSGQATEVISARCKKSLDGYPFIDSSSAVEDKFAAIYSHPSPGTDISEVKKFLVFRSVKEKGPYSFLEQRSSIESAFIDRSPMPSGYYKIAYDLGDGDTVFSAPVFVKIPDVIPPASPSALQGKIDSNGLVTLTWIRNKEEDLKGYRVFRSNSLNEEFIEVTNKILKDTCYVEKLPLNNLTEEVYYRITAVDRVNNNSKYTQHISLKKPDRIPPVAPVITKLTHTDSTINIEFISSSSSDIYKHIVLRSDVSANKIDTVAVLRSGEPKQKINDAGGKPGSIYAYEVVAVDDDGNRSEARSGEIKFQPKYFPAVKEILARAEREKRFIYIEWKYRSDDVYTYQVYKAKKGERFRLIETLPPGKLSMEDKEISVNNIYEYKVKVVFKSGSETKLSTPVEVVY